MDRVLINPAIVSDIADAIREKGGTTEQIVVNGLGDAVRALPSGGGIADSTKELVNIVAGVTPTDELSLNNGIAKGAVDAPTEQSWEGERTTAGGGTIKDGIAYLEKVKGRSIKLNQFANIENNSGVGRASVVVNEDGSFVVSNPNDAPSATNRLSAFVVPAGHKFLFYISCAEYGSANGFRTYANGDIPYAAAISDFRIIESTGASSSLQFNVKAQGTFYVKGVFILDLTEMGIDNLTTPDAVAQYLGYADAASMPFIPYTPETIVVHSKHSAVASKGRNLWDEEWEVGSFFQGNKMEGTSFFRSKNAIKVTPSTRICVATPYQLYINYFDENMVYQGAQSLNNDNTWLMPSNCHYLWIRNFKGVEGISYNHDICINISDSQNGTYTPYMSDTLALPSLELRGVGTAQDEYTPSTGEVVRKMGVVDLGVLNYTLEKGDVSQIATSRTILPNCFKPASNVTPKLICIGYSASSRNGQSQNPNKTIGITASGYLKITDALDAHPDAAAVKDSLQGILLFYELETPTTEQLTPQKAYYKAQSNGKEVAVAETLSAPFVAEIGYEEGTNAQVLNLL